MFFYLFNILFELFCLSLQKFACKKLKMWHICLFKTKNQIWTKITTNLIKPKQMKQISKIYLLLLMILLAGSNTALAQTDVTSSIVNPSFDGRGFGGWLNFGFQTQTNTAFSGKTYKAYAEKWVSATTTLPDCYLYQNISGLTNGQYILKVAAQAINQNNTSANQTGAYIVGNENTTEVHAAADYSVTFYVVDGTAKIGFYTESTTANWIACDNFRLTRNSTTTANLRSGLSALVTKANTLASSNMDSSVKNALNSAISNANNYTGNGSETNVIAAYATLKTAVKNAENAIYAYGKSASGGPTVVADTRYAVGNNIAFFRSTISGTYTESGYCYSTTNTTPTIADSHSTRYIDHMGYIYILDELTPATCYYVRPYAINGSNVGYGDVMRIYTQKQGTINYNFNTSNDTDIDARIKGSMESQTGYWRQAIAFSGYTPTANYNSGVQTADCSYGGWIRFGPSEDYQATGTSMHENLHGIGVGTDVTFSEHMEVYSSGPGASYGQWRGKRAAQLTQFWDNNTTEYITGGGSHVWATNSTNMISFTINGASEDAHSDLQYYGNALLAEALCEDGMCPVAYQTFPAGYCFRHTDNTKYYLRNTDSKYGLNTSTYLYASGTMLKLKTYDIDTEAKADNNAAWYIEFDPAGQFYYFKNVGTSKYLYTGSGNFAVSGTSKTSDTAVHLHLGWWDASFQSSSSTLAKDTYYLMYPQATAYPKSLTATESGAVTSANYSPYEAATASRWMILTADEMDEVSDALTDIQRTNVLEIIELVRNMATTNHSDNTGSANSTLSTTLSTIEDNVPTASMSELTQYYNDVIVACKTFLSNTTPSGYGYDITFLLTNTGMDGTDGWSGTTPTNNYSVNEFYQMTFDYYQTLSGMPSGSYRMKMQAYERPGSATDVYNDYMGGTDNVTAQIYIGSVSKKINNISAEAVSTKYGVGDESEVTYNEATAYIPNNMQAGANYFSKALYDNTLENDEFAGGYLTLGIRNTSYVTYDWTMFDNVRLYYLGNQSGETVEPLDGWTELSALPEDYSLYFFTLFDHTRGLGLVQKAGNHQGSGYMAAWYESDVVPGTDKRALWTFDSNVNDETEYVVMANANNPDYMMQTEWDESWFFRTHDNGGGDVSWGRTLFNYAEGKWTIQNGRYPEAGYLGPWDPGTWTETALNKTDDNIGYFDIYSMLRGEYVARYEMLTAASTANPIDISYVLENPGGERRSTIGWKTEGTAWQGQSNSVEGKVGSYYIEAYNSSGIGNSNIYQEIHGLPNGYYRFSARGFVRDGGDQGYSIYANSESTKVTASNFNTKYSVSVEVTDGTLLVGAKAVGVEKDWIALDDVKLEYIGTPDDYYVGVPEISLTDGQYIQSLTTVSYNYSYASSSQENATFALLNNTMATLNKGNTQVATGTLSLSGTTLTATFNGITLDTNSDYTITLPAGAVGYSGHLSNTAVTLNLHTPYLFDTTCYLLNNSTQKYLSRNGAYNTQAVVDEYGLAVQIVTDTEGHTRLKMFDNQLYVYDDGVRLYADGGTALIVAPQNNNGTYRFINQANQGFLAVDNDGYSIVADANVTNATVNWTLEPTASHTANYTTLANTQAATAATAAGYSDVATASALTGMIGTDLWAHEQTIVGKKEEKFEQYADIVEAGTDLDYYTETLETLTPGLYRVSVDAFQRAAYNDRVAAADGARGLIVLFANGAQTQLKSVMDYGATTAYASDYTYNGLHYPNNEASAYVALATGNYNNEVFVYVPANEGKTTGTLTFGIRILNRMGNGVKSGTWAAYDNFKVERLMPNITLSETSTTAPTAASAARVTLNRTIAANKWNTICFPFRLTKAQFKEAFGENTVVLRLAGTTTKKDVVDLSFETADEILANVPYVMKTDQGSESYLFSTIDVTPSDILTDEVNGIQFIGNYVYPKELDNIGGTDYYILDNKFYSSPGKHSL